MAPVVVQGVKDISPGPIPTRLEIRDLINKEENAKYWSLYVQAFTNLKNLKDELTNPLSYYQINGIHGYPHIPYDEATQNKDENYCAHSSPLFPTWHRAYNLLFEQAIQQEAMAIAQEYTVDKEAWVEAAIKLRQPYWDWALRGGAVPPAEFVDPKVEFITIITKDGKPNKVPNPFLSYKFSNDLDAKTKRVLNGKTYRRGDFIKALTNEATVAQRRGDALNTIVNATTWATFSNKVAPRVDRNPVTGEPVNSLETVHDAVHGNIGGSMGNQWTAAFDPIFHLHHCQIDRMVSLWKALHPALWVPDTGKSDEVTTTLLEPFRDTASSKWQSLGLTDTRKFNYTYSELEDLDTDSETGKEWLRDYLAHIYNDKKDPGDKPSKATGSFGPSGGAALFADDPTEDIETYTTDRWTVRLQCKAYEAGGTFTVIVFIGNEADLPADPNEWPFSPGFIGEFCVFANQEPATCPNCVEHLDDLVEGYVHLDKPLKDSVPLDDTDAVTTYLKDKLYWRVIQEEGDSYKSISLPSLEVTVRKDNISKRRGKPAITYSEPTYSEQYIRPY